MTGLMDKAMAFIADNMQLSQETFQNTAISLSSGTPGTYANQQTINIGKTGKTPICAYLTWNHPSSYTVQIAITSSTSLVLLFFRSISSAYSVPAKDVTVTVCYKGKP